MERKRTMKTSYRVVCFCVSAIALSFAPASYGQQNPTAPSQATAIRKTSEEVLLDVVVRDKKGRPVNNLKPEDFQIFDNGEQKQIIAFRLVQGGEAVAAGGARTQLDPLRQVRLVTMIFQCWNNDARRLAHDAAVGLLKGELPQNVYMAVMTIDHKLEVLQPFTNDPALLRKAMDRATGSQNTDFSKDTELCGRTSSRCWVPIPPAPSPRRARLTIGRPRSLPRDGMPTRPTW